MTFRLIRGDKPPETKLQKRARALGQPQIQAWTDTYLNETGRALLAYSREGDPRFLDEAEEAAVALVTLVQELKRRR